MGRKRSCARGNHLTSRPITTRLPPRALAISHMMPHHKYNRLGLEICGSYSRLGSSSTRRGYPPDRHSSQQRTKSAAANIRFGWRAHGTGSSPRRASRRLLRQTIRGARAFCAAQRESRAVSAARVRRPSQNRLRASSCSMLERSLPPPCV